MHGANGFGRRYLADAKVINAGAPIAKPLTREQAINIVTEQIGLFESVLRRYGGGENANRTYRSVSRLI